MVVKLGDVRVNFGYVVAKLVDVVYVQVQIHLVTKLAESYEKF